MNECKPLPRGRRVRRRADHHPRQQMLRMLVTCKQRARGGEGRRYDASVHYFIARMHRKLPLVVQLYTLAASSSLAWPIFP